METINKHSSKLVFVAIIALICSWAIIGDAGNLNPSAPPGPTMKTLDQIYDTASAGVLEREGYCRSFGVVGTENIFTVPVGKRFVLLKFQGHSTPDDSLDWTLVASDPTAGDTILIWGMARLDGSNAVVGRQYTDWWDFPDRCVVVEENQTLKLVTGTSTTVESAIIGYFYDAP